MSFLGGPAAEVDGRSGSLRGPRTGLLADLLLHRVFEDRVDAAPARAAVSFGGVTLTYAQLDARANQLAHHLLGVRAMAGATVGVCVRPSIELVVSMLAVLKTGAAYVPLDPDYPSDRLTFMIDDAGCSVVLTGAGGLSAAPLGSEVIDLHASASAIAAAPASRPAVEVDPRALAYVIYTSGTTGLPKGVMIEHGGIVHRILWRALQYGLGPEDRFVQRASTSFDASVLEIFGTLLPGAELVIAPENARRDPAELLALMADEGITGIEVAPALVRALVELPGLERCAALRNVFCGGEALSPEVAAAFSAQHPALLINVYGPAEVSVDATHFAVRMPVDGAVPIGSAVGDVETWVLDAQWRPVPPGDLGELYLGGIGVARGYWRRPALTAERFIPHPSSQVPGARLYRTGDLVRVRSDGQLEFAGRKDHQVKIRGIRIELEEIEQALTALPDVRGAVCTTHRDEGTDARLVAYVALRTAVPPASLRRQLARHLPAHMVPATFVFLDALPLSPNGKVARDRLPPPPSDSGPPVPPDGAQDGGAVATVLGIFRELLRLPDATADESFFLLGGHSLLATRVVQRVRERVGVDLPLRVIFERPTARALGTEVESRLAKGERSQLPPLTRQPVAPGEPHPVSFAQERLWFLVQMEPDNPFYNELTCVHLDGPLDARALRRAFDALAARHEVLRTRIVSVGGRPMQIVDAPAPVPLPVVDLTVLPEGGAGAEAAASDRRIVERARASAKRPFALDREPAWRSELLQTGTDRHVLLLTMHHIITDGWSIAVLMEELGALYAAERDGAPSALAAPVVQYLDFTRWQRQWLSGETFDRQLAYWRSRLAGASEVLELPIDRERTAVSTHRGGRIPIRLGRVETNRVRRLCQTEGVTPFIALEAAFRVLLFRLCGERDALVGTTVANRRASELEGSIGFFANTLVLRTPIDARESFRALLRRCRETSLEAHAHQDLPFEKLVEALNPDRVLNRMPLFQVAFQIQNAPVTSTLPGLAVRLEELDLGISKLDLWVSLQEEADGFEGVLEFDADLFDAESARRWAEQYVELVNALVCAPELPVGGRGSLPAALRAQVLETWTTGAPPARGTSAIHQCIREQASRTPDAPALVGAGSSYTYAQMEACAERVAAQLVAQGWRGRVVAGWIERSPEAVIALLAVLKAGATWLPLEVSAPIERIRSILSQAAPGLVLTRRRRAHSAREFDLPILELDDLLSNAASEDQALPAHDVPPEAVAYVIFTSGSTGRPKGVAVPHRGLASMADAVVKVTGLGLGARASHWLSLGFDASLHEILSTLVSGAALHIAPIDVLLQDGGLTGWLEREQITHVMGAPPSMLATLDPARLRTVQVLITGGEALSAELVSRWSGLRKLINMYGPTEVSITATAHVCRAGESGPPIGGPLPGVRVHVLGDDLDPVLAGAPGELYVGGIGVGVGYVGDPALTAERFIPDPFASEPGARLYRTGDRVRFSSTGALLFLGRVDEQVKLRGHRIEPGEISAVLKRMPGIADAVTVLREDAGGEPRLVSYVVEAGAGEDPAASDELVSTWRELFDRNYGEADSDEPGDPTFNIRGWNSSYTGEPIPADQMREWVEATVTRILALAPRRVMEIGCGSGLLLFRVAPHCEAYFAADFSQSALTALARSCARPALRVGHVRLSHRAAHQWSGLEEETPEVVVINSVAQYFPDVHYLFRVIESAVRKAGEGGRIFLGDIRSLGLLQAFATDIQLHHAAAGATCAQVRQAASTAVLQETELVVAHDFFRALMRHLPQLAHVDVRMKRGHAINELSAFRYDVVLHVGRVEGAVVVADWVPFDPEGWGGIARRVERGEHDTFAIRGIPDGRTLVAVTLASRLREERADAPACAVREAVQALGSGVDPEALCALAACHGYRVELGWWESAEGSGFFDAVFHRGTGERPVVVAGQIRRPLPPRDLGRYTNQPTRRTMTTALAQRLVPALQAVLPGYMVPAHIVRMDRLPLSASGKVDRRALPPPELPSTQRRSNLTPPRTGFERVVARAFAQTLGVDAVGADESFFELGGHSLLATRLVARLREQLGVEVPVRNVFQTPSVSALAASVVPVDEGGTDDIDEQVAALADSEVERRLAELISSQGRLS